MIDRNRHESLNKVLHKFAESLDITKTQYDNLVRSYGAVGKFLENTPTLQNYHPVVTPQGSLRLGTIIQPVHEDDDLDIDLVFRLTGKDISWTQQDIKKIVGNRLKDHSVYKSMLDAEGRRCWSLLYRQNSEDKKERYHMDILPCVVEEKYEEYVRCFDSNKFSIEKIDEIAIRITDKKTKNYYTSTFSHEWLKSNPDGYALWFASRCTICAQRSILLESVVPIGEYVEDKYILQRVVQLLKRHRDIMFNGADKKPISIIITTLAAYAYNGEDNPLDALCNIIDTMENYIEFDSMNNNFTICNPVNPNENFADKWKEDSQRKDNFFNWLNRLKKDKNELLTKTGVQLRHVFSRVFGEELSLQVFENNAQEHKTNALNAKIKVASTGMLGSVGKTLNANNTFYGEK